jgi:hypothetical protein
MDSLKECPVCGENTLEPGECVDVGFGLHMGVKAGPDHCENCRYIEAGPDPHDLPLEHYKKCWALKIDPYPEFPDLKHAPLQSQYAQWIDKNVDEHHGYGKCHPISTSMVATFPELTQVYGIYFCAIWGPRHHFWCIDSNSQIIDPTARQFPSKGNGIYRINYIEDLDAWSKLLERHIQRKTCANNCLAVEYKTASV